MFLDSSGAEWKVTPVSDNCIKLSCQGRYIAFKRSLWQLIGVEIKEVQCKKRSFDLYV